MMTEVAYNDVVKRLIAIGNIEDFANFPTLFSFSEQNEFPWLTDRSKSHILFINSLTVVGDIIALIKSLTIGEKVFPRWSAGSVSPVIPLFWRLYELDPDQADIVSVWVVAHTRNPYSPFGRMTCGQVKTVAEYREWEIYKAKSHLRALEEEEKRQLIIKEIKNAREAEKATQNLFNAVRRCDEKAVESLLNKGARIDGADKDGISISKLAEAQGNQKIIELLNNASSKIQLNDKKEGTTSH